MGNFNAREKFYNAINRAYTLNYTAMRLANQDPPSIGAYYANDIFNKSPKDERLTNKRSSFARIRNEQLEMLADALSESSDELKIIKNELESAKLLLTEHYNQMFGTNKNFSDLFDGFNCIDDNIKAMVEGHTIETINNVSSDDLQVFLNNYVYYIDIFEKYTLAPIYIDLIRQLNDSISEYGYKTPYFDRPQNPMISRLKKDEITELIQCSATLMVDLDNEYKRLEKELNKAYKLGAKKNADVFESANLVNQLTAEMAHVGPNSTLAEELFDIATAFETRLKSANTDCDTSLRFKLTEKFGDRLAGIETSGQFNVDEIFVHKYELDYIKFLFKMLDTSPEKIKAEHLPSAETTNSKTNA